MRISTGIVGLDKMLNGGLISNKLYLIKGGPGTGKTTLSTHFTMEGLKNGEVVMYITLGESKEEIKEEMSMFGFGFDEDKVVFIDASPTGDSTIFGDMYFANLVPDIQGFRAVLEHKLEENRPTRVVIDPITMLELASKNELEYRRDLLSLMQILRKYNTTTLMTTEKRNDSPEDYIVSGVIELLTFDVGGKTIRGIKITKMRGSDFDDSIRPYRFTSKGIEVYPESKIFE